MLPTAHTYGSPMILKGYASATTPRPFLRALLALTREILARRVDNARPPCPCGERLSVIGRLCAPCRHEASAA